MPAKLNRIEIMPILRIGMQSNADSSDEKGITWAEHAGKTNLRNL